MSRKLHAIKYFQFLFIPGWKLFLQVVVKQQKIHLRASGIDNSSYVIVSNHQGMLDPFIICYSLDFSIHRQLAPYAFLVANRFFSYPIVKHVLIALGGFPAKWHKKYPSGLAHTQTLLKKGSTVAIFPEGRISAHDRQFRPKKGVEVLANSQNTLLIPARIKWNRRKGFIKSYSIAVGNPFDGKNMTADQIMDVVYSLKFR